jgi:hypothetical protein
MLLKLVRLCHHLYIVFCIISFSVFVVTVSGNIDFFKEFGKLAISVNIILAFTFLVVGIVLETIHYHKVINK